jgi:type I restriction enzyme, S subunit
MTFRRYEKYKDSGVAWLGEVPGHWVVAAVAYRYEVLLGKMLDEKRISGNHLAPYLRNVDVQWDRINIGDLPVMDFAGADLERYGLVAGDLLVCEGGEVGRAAIWPAGQAECYYQKALHRLRRRDESADSPRFMFYVLRAAATLGVFDASEGKSTIAHLTAEALRRYRFGFPASEEQAAIATFLDHETAKIDALVGEQKRLIELLKEKRQAVISHAVTKGLNPNAPMKDSGVAWLGEVPAHWDVKPLKYVAAFRSGGTPDKGRLDYWDGDVPWASAKDLKVEELFDTGDHITTAALEDGAASMVPAGSVLVVVRGMILARMFPVVTARVPMAINQDLKAVTAGLNAVAEFLPWLLRGSAAESLSLLDEAGHGTKALRMDAWGDMKVAVPPPGEQAQIADHLYTACSEIDVGLDVVARGVALLRERRTALISAAVTGKIDVRPAAQHPDRHATCKAESH